MSSLSVPEVVVPWNYGSQTIEVPCFDNVPHLEGENPGLPLLLLPGYGENQHITRSTVARLGEQGIPAVGVVLPFNKLPAERLAIETACVEVPHVVGDFFKARLGLALKIRSQLLATRKAAAYGPWRAGNALKVWVMLCSGHRSALWEIGGQAGFDIGTRRFKPKVGFAVRRAATGD